MISAEVPMSASSTGPSTTPGLIVANSRSLASDCTKSRAARSASVFDRAYGVTAGLPRSVQSVSDKVRRPDAWCP